MKTTWQKIIKLAPIFLFTALVILAAARGSTDTAPADSTNIKTAEPKIEPETKKDLRLPASAKEDSQKPAAKKEPDTLSLVMVGDILLHTPVAESGLQADGSYNYDALFAQIAPAVKKADLALVNQEVILGGSELGISGYPCFNAPYELGDALVDAGFTVILHATNHVLDKGEQGLKNCLRYWKKNHPDTAVLGIHGSQKAQDKIYVYEHNGIRTAILNYTYGTNGIPLPETMPYAVDLLDEKRIKKDLAKARRAADFVIICPHWGTEFLPDASDEQKYWTKLFLKYGADLVIGTHPHVIEPVEWVKGRNKKMLVFYSLGNFTNWTSSTGSGVSDRMVGGMAKVKLQRKDDGSVTIADYKMTPLVTHLKSGRNGVTTYFLKDYTKKLASQNEIRKQDPAFSLQYCRRLCQKAGILR